MLDQSAETRPSSKKHGRGLESVSMREVAARAGYSRSAVSLALQGHPSIPATTRQMILDAAQKLGYRKNPLVAALMRSRRSRKSQDAPRAPLAFLTSHPPNDSWRQAATHHRFHAAAVTRASELGFQLDEFSIANPALRPDRVRALLKARGIHGLLIAPLPGGNTQLDFDLTDFAAVGLGLSVRVPEIDRIADDHFFSTQLAFERGLALGYRRIGLALAAGVSRRLEDRWWSGYLLAQQQVAPRARIPALMPETREEIPAKLTDWITRHRVDAVIFSLRAPELMKRASPSVGLISLSVLDASGKIAGIRQDTHRIGAGGIDLLVGKLQHWSTEANQPPRLLLVRGAWCDGASAPGPGKNRRTLV